MTDAEELLAETCWLLRENDTTVTSVSSSRLPAGYGRQLGEALVGNTCVTHLNLCIGDFLDEEENDTNTAMYMVQFIQSSPALKSVVLQGSDAGNPLDINLVGILVNAVAESTSIESLDAQITIPPLSMANLLRQTTSLKNLRLSTLDGMEESPTQRLVADALRSNQTLDDISISTVSNIASQALFSSLSSHPKIRKLTLGPGEEASVGSEGHFEALAQMLRATQTLQHIRLENYKFDKESTKLVFSAIQSNPLVSKLSLVGCSFDNKATTTLTRFMQDKKHHSVPILRELEVQPLVRDDVFEYMSSGRALAMMMPFSSLESLDLGGDDTAVFFLLLRQRASKVSLSTLQLTHLSTVDLDFTSVFLPRTTSLQRLTVTGIDPAADRNLFLYKLRQNGSLRHFSITNRQQNVGEPPLLWFHGPELTLLEAYLERNRQVPLLLAKPCLFSDDDTSDTEYTHLNMFPSLFETTLPARTTAANNMLIGLLASIGDVIGPLNPNRREKEPEPKRQRYR